MLTARDWGKLLGCKFTDGYMAWTMNYCTGGYIYPVEQGDGRFRAEVCKPILRTFDQMTEEEWVIYCDLDKFGDALNKSKTVDYLDSIHVDQRGWIDQGLAIKEGE